jgi:multiple sugar transport system substrate-binding protein
MKTGRVCKLTTRKVFWELIRKRSSHPKNKFFLIGILVIGSILLAGCEKHTNSSPAIKSPDSSEDAPAKISFYLYTMPQNQFDYIVAAAKKKFPNYTLDSIPNTNAGGPTIDDMVASGTVPDLFTARGVATPELQSRGLLYDLSDLMKKNNFDTGRLEPLAFEQMKGETGGIIAGIPYSMAHGGYMYYNKDLFDKFGVPYPKDGMTWDDVYEIAKKMTRTEDGVTYRGFAERWISTFFDMNPFGATYLSQTEDKAAVNTDQWRMIVNNFLRFYTLPGFKYDHKANNNDQDWKTFIDGRAAMCVFASRNYMNWQFNWDVVSLPTYKELPGIGKTSDFTNLYITSSSKNKDAAFKVAAWMVSDEMQSNMAADIGVYPPVRSDAVRQNYLKNDPLFKGKNVKAAQINKLSPAPERKPGLTQLNGSKLFAGEIEKVLTEGEDLNSAFRSAEEQINKAIAEEKAKR